MVLTREKIASLWEKFQQFPVAFDDFTRGNYDYFVRTMFAPDSMIYEIGDELGIGSATNVVPSLDAMIHLIMFDRRLKGREPVFFDILDDIFRRANLQRVTCAYPANRETGIKLIERMGFTLEGTLRKSRLHEGEYIDVHVYGLLRKEMYGG